MENKVPVPWKFGSFRDGPCEERGFSPIMFSEHILAPVEAQLQKALAKDSRSELASPLYLAKALFYVKGVSDNSLIATHM